MTSVLLCALLLQAPAPAAKAGVIRGRVVAAEGGRPIARASVTATSTADARVARVTASTNSQGRFEIKDVPPGAYIVSVARRGYLTVRFGQRHATERGLTVDVADGAAVDNIDVSLSRPSVLGGRITDELGEAYPGVTVVALAPRYGGGRRTASVVGTSTTNDLGQFRLANLPPGAYTIAAISTETWRNERQEALGYATTFYPGGPPALAQTVTLAAAQQRLDLDVSLRPVRAVRVSGHVVTPRGQPGNVPGVTLTYRFGDGTLFGVFRAGRVAGDGSFEVEDVTEGAYMLRTTGSLDEPLTVGDADVSGLTLLMGSGSTLLGGIVTDEGAPPPFRLGAIRVFLEAATERVLSSGRIFTPDPDGSFKAPGIGGPFLFRLTGLPDGWMLGEVRLGERTITDVPYDVPMGPGEVSGLTMVVTKKGARVAGTVVDSAGKATAAATVVLFAEDDKLWTRASRFTRALRPGADGRFTIAGLPAGTYRIVARDEIEEGQWEDRAFLEETRDRATRIVLAEGGVEAVTLRLPAVR